MVSPLNDRLQLKCDAAVKGDHTHRKSTVDVAAHGALYLGSAPGIQQKHPAGLPLTDKLRHIIP